MRIRPAHLPLLALSTLSAAHAATFDVYTFTPPSGWTQTTAKGVTRVSRNAGGQYCLFDLYPATKGSGNVKQDFRSEWNTLVVKPFGPDDAPEEESGDPVGGWQSHLGGASFAYEGGTSLAVLATFSAAGQAASVLMLGNDEKCLEQFDAFLTTLRLKAPAAQTTAAPTPPKPAPAPATGALNTAPLKSSFKFDTTTFDDGWVAVVQKDWVLARRGTTTVRLHYPSGPSYNPDSDAELRAAWNTLVAPRYRDLQGYAQNFDTLNFERPYLASGTATSLETGARVYVALFRQAESGWIEIVTPDRDTFLKDFKLDPAQFYGVDDALLRPLRNLRGLNRFAVAASDLTGTWSSNAGGYTQWVNAFTGLSAGATGFSSNETFEFTGNGTYRWSLAMASGVVGAQTFSGAKSSGKHAMKGNWQISFSDIEGKPRVYNAYFEAGRGGQRILWMQSVGSYSAYVKVK
ncbi:hypothetical protein [Deinococcus radiotolerans]|uniref:Uncharacterized protein n=1 Tax=Deinococcus radiotolerans TaxID=1309407 RepID=A0ABQ2FKT9_9DEIO|nr:hypothetical protein [Deinococcus radiotolerans]GGL04996.1 hypothetical protein GCM10010844_24690 [Deinococcus radiotolerans]